MPSPLRLSSEQAIIESAIALLSANAGATMSEIALNAGVGRATLHRHFKTRDELIRAIKERCITETNAAVAALDDPEMPAAERLLNMLTAVIPLGDRYNFLSQEAVTDTALRSGYRAQLDWLTDLVALLQSDGVIARDLPVSWVVAQIDQIIWTAWCEVSAGRLAPSDAPELGMRTLINGLGAQS